MKTKSKNVIKSFIVKWFFPPSFSVIFYPSFLIVWFISVDEWNRTLSNFYYYTIFMIAVFSIFYLGMDPNDGRFTKFINYVESQNKFKKNLIVVLIFIIYFILMAWGINNSPFN